jgi:hypothetical protein
MKTTTLEIESHQWPYGLEVQPSKNGLLLRPRRKARAGWARAFARPLLKKDEIAPMRQMANKFDATEWKW